MKMLKKAAAVLLAAAMSLTMLTACGGGSGSTTQYKLAKVLAESQQTGKAYSDITTTIDGSAIAPALAGQKMNIRAKTAVDSKAGKTCTFVDFGVNGESWECYLATKDGTYELAEDENNNPYWEKVQNNAMLNMANAATPSNVNVSSLQIKQDYEFNGTTYYAEVLNSEGTEIAYLFVGDTLKYIVITTGSIQIVETVHEMSGHFPAQISGNVPVSYDELMNLKTVG